MSDFLHCLSTGEDPHGRIGDGCVAQMVARSTSRAR
jgi:hypothetical protein